MGFTSPQALVVPSLCCVGDTTAVLWAKSDTTKQCLLFKNVYTVSTIPVYYIHCTILYNCTSQGFALLRTLKKQSTDLAACSNVNDEKLLNLILPLVSYPLMVLTEST